MKPKFNTLIRRLVLVALLLTVFVLPAAAGPDSGPLRVVAYTQRSVTVGWTGISGASFNLYLNGTKVGTAGATATSARVNVSGWGTKMIGVGAVNAGAESLYTISVQGEWVATAQTQPAPVISTPAPTPPAPVTSTPAPTPPAPPAPSPPAPPPPAPSPPPPTSPPTSTASTANLWVSPSGGTCARQAAAAPFASAQACGSFAAAFSTAQCGDAIGVEAGSYPAQTVTAAKSCTVATPVTFVAAGAVTLTGGLDIKASYVGFSGAFDFAQTYAVEQGANYVALQGVSAPHAFVMGSHVAITGGQIGPNNSCNTGWEDGLQIWDNGSASASYVTVDGVTFHDVSDNGNECSGYANTGVHDDCIQLLGASNVTIENSHFYNCATSDVIGRPYSTPLSNITIQNNMMGPVVTPGASINIGNTADVCTNVVIQYNTVFGTYPSAVCGGSGSSGNFVLGNIFPGYYPAAGFTSAYNISEDTAPLGTGSKKCTPAFAVLASLVADYHLLARDTCAIGAGDPANYPPTDIDGQARPQGGTVDAGADEATG